MIFGWGLELRLMWDEIFLFVVISTRALPSLL